MTQAEILTRMRDDLNNGIMKVVASDGYRYYTDVLTEEMNIPLTTTAETAKLYKKLVIDAAIAVNTPSAQTGNPFLRLPRVSMYIGQPDTGKTYKAIKVAESCGLDPLIKMCRDSLNLETLLEDFTLKDGKPIFEESLALKMLSGTDNGVIILDEFNTLLTGVMKTLQPIFDDTSTTFEYRGKVYNKNLNCKFIVTLNDKDKGISVVPDAILSRSKLEWFEPVPVPILAQWTKVPLKWIQTIYNVYKIAGLLGVFGTRQIKMLRQLPDVASIKNHLYGLCMMKNIDAKIIDQLQTTNMLNQL
jgi:hypothetical protein